METLQAAGRDPGGIQARIEEIRRDRASGAAKLAVRAATLLIKCTQESPEEVPAVVRALLDAQPAMGTVFNLGWRVLSSSDVPSTCREFLESMERSTARVAETAAGLIKDGSKVMTHSFSSTILVALREASRQGRRFSVVCPESRPVCEGIAMAASLGMVGIPASVIADAAIFRLLPEVDLVCVGADAVSERGIFNKTGTALLALAARELRKPVYALCSSDKLLPPSYDPPMEAPKDPREILERELPHVTAVNYYFDVTPLDCVCGIVTENGVLTPSEMREKLLGMAPAGEGRALVGPVHARDSAVAPRSLTFTPGLGWPQTDGCGA
jgi:translation initiation factor eIF-2B subunit delta